MGVSLGWCLKRYPFGCKFAKRRFTMDKKEGWTEVILALLLIPVLMGVSVVTSGYALTILWGWFVVPTFGAPALSIPVAFGLSLIVSFMTHQESKSAKSDDDGFWRTLFKSFFIAIIRPGYALLLGWAVHLFM